LLHALLGNDASLTPLTHLLIARTEGNPFFLEESVRTLVETGVLVGTPGAYGLGQALPPICARIPWVPLDSMPLGCNGHALLFAHLAAIEDIKRLGRQPL